MESGGASDTCAYCNGIVLPRVHNNSRAKTNILNESERITFTTNEYSNILQVFSIKLLP